MSAPIRRGSQRAALASRTVPVALALFPGVFDIPWGDIAAASMLASVPTVLIVIGLQRYLIDGLVAGRGEGLKGPALPRQRSFG